MSNTNVPNSRAVNLLLLFDELEKITQLKILILINTKTGPGNRPLDEIHSLASLAGRY